MHYLKLLLNAFSTARFFKVTHWTMDFYSVEHSLSCVSVVSDEPFLHIFETIQIFYTDCNTFASVYLGVSGCVCVLYVNVCGCVAQGS